MPTSVREAALDEVVRLMRLIGSSASYSATVQPTVSRVRHPNTGLPQMPFIYVGGAGEDYERIGSIGAAVTDAKTLHVEVLYVFASANMDQDVSRAVHDVEYAIRDWNLGGASSDVEIQNYAVDAITDAEPVVVVTFQIDVRYRTDDNAPATRV